MIVCNAQRFRLTLATFCQIQIELKKILLKTKLHSFLISHIGHFISLI